MRFFSTLRILLAACLLPAIASALTNDDIVKMHKGGLGDETIIAAIKPDTASFDTSPDALIALKSAGISDAIIRKMLAPGSEATAAAPVAAPAKPSVFFDPMPSIAPPLINPVSGQQYFTRYSFHEEKDEYLTTNYSRGNLVPINTAVTLLGLTDDTLRLRLIDSGRVITVKNVGKYSRKSLAEIARFLLAAEKTPLEKLPPAVAAAVAQGEMHKGMTKELVLMTRGYPPGHETPSLDADRWVYWTSRFVKLTLLFSDGRLVEGRGLL